MCIRHHVRVQNEFVVDASTREIPEETLTESGRNARSEQNDECLLRIPAAASSFDCKGRALLDEAQAIRELHPRYWSEGRQNVAFRSKRRASTSWNAGIGAADRALEGAVHKLLPTPPDSKARHYRDGTVCWGVPTAFRVPRRPQSARQFLRTTDADPSPGRGLFSLTSVTVASTMGALKEDGVPSGGDETKKFLGCKQPPYAISSWGGGADYLGQGDRRIMRVLDFGKMTPRVSAASECVHSGPNVEAQRSPRQKDADKETRPRVTAVDAAEGKTLFRKECSEGTASTSAAVNGGGTQSASDVPMADATRADDAGATKDVCPYRAPERARIIYDYASFLQGTGHRVESDPKRYTANSAPQLYPRACGHAPSVKLGSYSSRADAQFAAGRLMTHTKGNIASGAPPPLPPSVEAARALVKDAIAKGTFACINQNEAKRSYRYFGKYNSDATMNPKAPADNKRADIPCVRASPRALDHRRTDDEEVIAQSLIDEAELRYVLSDAGASRVRARAALRAHYRHRPYSDMPQYDYDRDVGDLKSKATARSYPTRQSRFRGYSANEFTSTAATGHIMSSPSKKTMHTTAEALSLGRGANHNITSSSREGDTRELHDVDRRDSVADSLTRVERSKTESCRANTTNKVQIPTSPATTGWRKRSVFDAYSTI